MAGTRTFKIQLVGDARDAVNAFQQLGQHMSGVNTRSVTLGTTLGNLISRGITALAGNVLDAAGALFAFAGQSIHAAEESQAVDNKLGNVAKSMGLFGKETANVVSRMQDYATQTMSQIGVDDEAIKTVQTKLLTFKELGKTAGETGGAFDRATKAAFDLASAGFGTAETNAVQLGKALQDPVKGLTALSRAGVTFTADEKERIKTLVESNRLGEAQAIILGAIEKQVGGTAAASATASQKMSIAWDEVKESVGEALLPMFQELAKWITTEVLPAFKAWWSEHAPQVKQALKDFAYWIKDKAVPALQDFWKWIQDNVLPVVKRYAEYLRDDVFPAVEKFTTALGDLKTSLEQIIGPTDDSKQSFDLLAIVFGGLSDALARVGFFVDLASARFRDLGMVGEFVREAISKITDIIRSTIETAKTMPGQIVASIGDVIGLLKQKGLDLFEGFKQGIGEKWAEVSGWLGGLPTRIWEVVGNLGGSLVTRGREAISGLATGIADRWNDLWAWLSGMGTRIASAIGGLGSALFTRGREAIGGLAEGVSNRWSGLSDWFGGLGERVRNAIGDVGGLLFGAGKAIIQSLWNGIASLWDEVKSKIKSITDWISKNKGPESRDRRLWTPAGQWIMQSLQDGLDNEMPNLEAKVTGITGMLSADITTGGAPVLSPGGRGGNVYNVTVYASPAADLREVGRVTVEAIKQYERSSGPVFAAA